MKILCGEIRLRSVVVKVRAYELAFLGIEHKSGGEYRQYDSLVEAKSFILMLVIWRSKQATIMSVS